MGASQQVTPQDIKAITSAAQIADFRWQEIHSEIAVDGLSTPVVHLRHKCKGTQEEGGIRVQIRFELDAGSSEGGDVEFSMRAQAQLFYALPQEAPQFSAELVSGFAQFNGVYNAWPFWRELVADMANRAGIREPMLIPLWKLAEVVSSEKAKQE